MAEKQVRRATAPDNELIARLGREAFPGNFVGTTEPPAMASYIEARFNPEVQGNELAEPGSVFFIAQEGSEPVGFARLRNDEPPAPADVARPTAEIHRLYVLRPYWGNGHGRALIEACIEEAKERGLASVWLGAWSENERTLGFYGSLGFEQAGTQFFQIGEERHLDLILTLRLPTSSSQAGQA